MSCLRSVAILSAITTSVATMPTAAQCESAWQMNSLSPSGINGTVNGMAAFDAGDGPKLYVCGSDLNIDGFPLHNVAFFDGVEWKNVGGIEGNAFAMVAFDNGSGSALYVAGSFQGNSNLPNVGLARWDGRQWTPVPGAPPAIIQMTAFDDGHGPALFAANVEYSSPLRYHVHKWNGNDWSPLGDAFDKTIYALRGFNDGHGPTLFASGSFKKIGATTVNNIARWTGQTWAPVAGAVPHPPNSSVPDPAIYSLSVYDDGAGPALYAGGKFSWTGGELLNIARWNGSDWTPVGGGIMNYIRSLTPWDDGTGPALYASGVFRLPGESTDHYVVRWNGVDWSAPIPNPRRIPIRLIALDCGTGSTLYANVGNEYYRPAVLQYSIGAWNPVAPHSAGSPTGYPTYDGVSDLAVYDDGTGPALYVAGIFTQAGDVSAFNLAKWNGTTWSAVPGRPDGTIAALCVFDEGSGPALYVAGYFGSAPAASILRWDGSHWSTLQGDILGYIASLTVHNDGAGLALYIGGRFKKVGDTEANNIAKWNGTHWSAVGQGTDDYVSCLASWTDAEGSFVYAGGSFYVAGSVHARGLARWDGKSWSAVGGGLTMGYEGGVTCIAPLDDGTGPALYVGGWFETAGGIPVQNIARWRGSKWSALGDGIYGFPYALAAFDDGSGPAIYAAGDFESAGAVAASNIARWDGRVWRSCGTGVYDDRYDYDDYALVRTLLAFDDGHGPSLFIGGHFKAVDNHAFRNFAALRHAGPSTPTMLSATDSQALCAGESLVLSVDASSSTNLRYQWRKNGNDLTDQDGISGSHTPNLHLNTIAANFWDTYDCRVSDSDCEVVSAVAYVYVYASPPVLTRQPSSQIVDVGNTVTLQTSISDNRDDYAKQWRKNGVPLANTGNVGGVNSWTLTIRSATFADAGLYDCVITNPCGTTTSNPARLTVLGTVPPPAKPIGPIPANPG